MTERFKDAIWLSVAQTHNITIGGAGGIGSCVAFLLARIHPKSITLYDNDRINNLNLSNQLFRTTDQNKLKIEAINEIIFEFSTYYIHCKEEQFTENTSTNDIYFSCFDTMKARKNMFSVFKKSVENYNNSEEEPKPLLIDGRLTAEQFQIYIVTTDKIDEYEKTLFDDSEATILPCGFKGTTHNSFMIASKMVACYTNFCANIKTEDNSRTIPFMIDNDIYTMTENIKL